MIDVIIRTFTVCEWKIIGVASLQVEWNVDACEDANAATLSAPQISDQHSNYCIADHHGICSASWSSGHATWDYRFIKPRRHYRCYPFLPPQLQSRGDNLKSLEKAGNGQKPSQNGTGIFIRGECKNWKSLKTSSDHQAINLAKLVFFWTFCVAFACHFFFAVRRLLLW